jgi:serine/threonine protein kinase
MDSNNVQKISGETLRLRRGADLQQKQVVGGRYEIISSLGEGGMGHVYKVNQIFLNKEFAFKTININRVSEVAIRRFQQEARTAFALDHPSIVAVNDFGVLDDQSPFLVMELVIGETLGDRLKKLGCLSLEQAIPIFVQVCFGLAYAHERGIVHRDIKPSNIMLLNGLPPGTDGSVKIVDFGIAKFVQHDEGVVQALTRTGEIFGSPLYMSPEQCTGGPVDRRSDIYSLGCVFFEVLSGAPPCLGDTALATMMKHQSEKPSSLKQASLGADFSQAIEDMVAKMLEKSPENRYQNLGIIVHELGAMQRGLPMSGTATRPGVTQTVAGQAAVGQTVAGQTATGRTAAARAAAGQSAAAQTAATSKLGATTITISKNKFYALLVGISLVSFAFGSTLHQIQSRTLPVVSQAADDSNAPPKILLDATNVAKDLKIATDAREQDVRKWEPIFAQAKPIKSKPVMENGIKKKQFIFPDRSIGRIVNLSTKANSVATKNESWEAKRAVSVPPDVPLGLEVGGRTSAVILEIPSIMQKIDRNEFSDLVLTGPEDASWLMAASEQPNMLADRVAQILNTVSTWSNLHSLSLKCMTVNNALLSALASLKQLQNLTLSKFVPTSGMAHQTFLRRLVFLRLDDMPVDDILRSLSGSPNLEFLALDGNVKPISPDAVQGLGRCPHLKFLRIPQSAINDQMIVALKQIKSLQSLDVTGFDSLTPSQRHSLSGQSFALVR